MRSTASWRLRTRTLELGLRTLVMGAVNITPDSFSDGGLFLDPEAAVVHGLKMIEEGADLLDLGAESTRPGSRAGGADAAVSAEEEQARLLPVLEGILRARPDAILSVDTYKAETARAALEAGAEIVNDVSGFTWEPGIAEVCAKFDAGVVLTHTRGRPEEWRAQRRLEPDALLAMVREGLVASLGAARARRNSGPGHRARSRIRIRQAARGELRAACAAGGAARSGTAIVGGAEPQVVSGAHAGAAVSRWRSADECAREREPGRNDGGDSAWGVDRARACGAAGGGSGADRRCGLRGGANQR